VLIIDCTRLRDVVPGDRLTHCFDICVCLETRRVNGD
jgi:hypothetical protein